MVNVMSQTEDCECIPKDDHPRHSSFSQTNLVSSKPGAARFTFSRFLAPWGLVCGKRVPWWISINGTGFSAVYGGYGEDAPLALVKIPLPPGSLLGRIARPTGVV